MRYRTLESDKIQQQQTRGAHPRSRQGLSTPRWSVHSTRRKDTERRAGRTLRVTFKNDHRATSSKVRKPLAQSSRHLGSAGFSGAPEGVVLSRTVPGFGKIRDRGKGKLRGPVDRVRVNIPNDRAVWREEEDDKDPMMSNRGSKKLDLDAWRRVEREDEDVQSGGGEAMDAEDSTRLQKERLVEVPDEEARESSLAGCSSLNSKFTNIMQKRETKMKKSRKLGRRQRMGNVIVV